MLKSCMLCLSGKALGYFAFLFDSRQETWRNRLVVMTYINYYYIILSTWRSNGSRCPSFSPYLKGSARPPGGGPTFRPFASAISFFWYLPKALDNRWGLEVDGLENREPCLPAQPFRYSTVYRQRTMAMRLSLRSSCGRISWNQLEIHANSWLSMDTILMLAPARISLSHQWRD